MTCGGIGTKMTEQDGGKEKKLIGRITRKQILKSNNVFCIITNFFFITNYSSSFLIN